MKPFGRILAVARPVHCRVSLREQHPNEGRLLAASGGFKATPPKTQAQIASFNSLPPHKLTKVTHKGKTVWIYSDPTVCGCLYIGDQHAHDVYLQKMAATDDRRHELP